MELLRTLLSSFNPLKDILIPLLAASLGFWLASRKFRKEKLWQEKYSAYQEILGAIEAMAYWSEEASADSAMLPTIGWFDGKSSHEFYAQARRQISKHVSIGRLLISSQSVDLLEQFQIDVFRESFRAEEERSGDPNEHDADFGVHAQEVRKIIAKYLPQVTASARVDLEA